MSAGLCPWPDGIQRFWPADTTTTNNACVNDDAQRADAIVTCGDMDGMGPTPDVSTQELTTFLHEATCALEVRSGGIPDPQEYNDNAEVDDVKKYLSRPQVLKTGDYTIDSKETLFSQRVDLGFWTGHTHFPKVLGSYGIRATTCFKLVIAATPYHAGILRLSFSPLSDITYWDLPQISQMPGLELNLSDSTSLEFRVPFIHEDNFAQVNDLQSGFLGYLFLSRMLPLLVAPGTDSVPYTIYWWLEDIELVGALPAPIARDYLEAQKKILDSLSVVDQSGKSVFSKEEEVKPARFSAIASSGARLTRFAGKMMPTLASVTGPLDWFLRQTAKVAASYGYAKPLQTGAVSRMLPTINNYQFNVDGFDTSYNLGATVDTRLALTQFAGTDIDEMTFAYLTSIYSRFDSFNMLKTSARDATLWSTALQPMLFYDNDNGSARRAPTTLCFLSQFFRLWRGGFKFRFKVAKTQFHTGRLIVGYIPHNESAGTLPSTSYAMDYKSVVWDLRQDSFLEFECPFISPTAYIDRGEHSGHIFVKVLDPLRAPDAVSSVVGFTVEVCGGDDLEYAIPVGSYSSFVLGPYEPGVKIVDQAGDMSVFSQPKLPYCQQTIGNRLLSLKQLLSRSRSHGIITAATDIDYPRELMMATYTEFPDQHAAIISCYGLWRGGWRLSLVPTTPAAVPTVSYDASSLGTEPQTSYSPSLTETSASVHALVPYYRNRSRCIVARSTDSFTKVTCLSNKDPSALFCALGEDFQLGYFRCCPWIVVR